LIDPLPLLAAWRAAGQSPSHFWDLTLREISAILDGAAEQERRAHNDRAWLAWNIAALSRVHRLPKLSTLTVSRQKSKPRPRPRQTVEEQMAIARQWTAVV
jgi:hypothetical protein